MKWTILILLMCSFISSCSKSDHGEHNDSLATSLNASVETYYTCSMHPAIREQAPGKCPICHMNLSKIEVEKEGNDNYEETEDAIESKHSDLFYCESDQDVVSEVPGECPLDGTPMLKREKAKKSQSIVARVKLRKSQVKHFKADLFPVTTMKMQKKIRLLGTLLKSEEKESNIPARIDGRVEKVFVGSTGVLIKRGDPVLKFYSPRLLTGGEEYLIARKNYFANRRNKEFKDLFEQSAQRMQLWGVLNTQLEAWAKTKKIPREIIIHSPVTGIVVIKNAIKGKYFKEGESFFNLVDLSSIWVEMDVYEHDSALINIGQIVSFQFSAYPGETWSGKIDFINPVLDSTTRTLKMRTTLQNGDGKLRPGMVGDANLTVDYPGMPLVIPRSAIIDTGKRKVVWLDKGNNTYQAKTIHTGFESEGYVEVKHGIKENEKVVIDGNFLLDAQAQLTGGYEDSNATGTHQH